MQRVPASGAMKTAIPTLPASKDLQEDNWHILTCLLPIVDAKKQWNIIQN